MQSKIKRILSIILSLCVILSAFAIRTPALASDTTRVDYENSWAKETIAVLLERGIISPDDANGNVNPQIPITRAEVAAAINKMYGYTRTAAIDYKDADSSAWYYKDLQIARAEGYMIGDGANVHPNDPISRQELSTVMGKILKLPQGKEYAGTFVDVKNIAGWSVDFVGALAKANVLLGYPDGKFQPKNNITRAEAYAVMLRSEKRLMADRNNAAELSSVTVTSNLGDGVKIQNYMDVTVAKKGVTLDGVVVNGDLIIAKDVADGNVTLNNVTVKGITYIYGGGKNSVGMTNCNLGYVVLNSEYNTRLVFDGTGSHSVAGIITLSGGIIDVQNAVNPNISVAAGTPESAVVTIRGTVNGIEIKAQATLIVEGKVNLLNALTVLAARAKIMLNTGSTVTTANFSVPVHVSGSGNIITANINSDGVVIDVNYNQGGNSQSSNSQGGGNPGGNQSGSNPGGNPGGNNQTNYAITVQNDGNGTASGSLTAASAGTTVALTATPNSGYQFKEWQVVAGTVSISGDTFVMPAENVTIKAVFEAVNPPNTGNLFAAWDFDGDQGLAEYWDYEISVQTDQQKANDGSYVFYIPNETIGANIDRIFVSENTPKTESPATIKIIENWLNKPLGGYPTFTYTGGVAAGTYTVPAGTDVVLAPTDATGYTLENIKLFGLTVDEVNFKAMAGETYTVVFIYADESLPKNRMPNGNFSLGLSGWTVSGGKGLGYGLTLEDDAERGKALEFSGAEGFNMYTSPRIPVKSGDVYTLTWWAKSEGGTVTLFSANYDSGSGWNDQGNFAMGVEPAAGAGWQKFEKTFHAAADGYQFVQFIYPGNGEIALADIRFVKDGEITLGKLIPNGNFLLGLAGWGVGNGKGLGNGLAIHSDAAHGKALEFSGTENFSIFAEPRIPVKSGEVYTLTWWAKSDGGGSATLYSENYDAADSWNSQGNFAVGVTPAAGAGWQKFEKTFQVTADGYLFLQFIYPGNGTIAIADIDLVKDGEAAIIPGNLIPNGNFLDGLNGWSGKALGDGLEIKNDAQKGKALEFSGTDGFNINMWLPVESGEYTLTWWAKSEGGSAVLYSDNYDEAGSSLSVAVNPPVGSGWQKFEQTFSVPAYKWMFVQFIYSGNGAVSLANVSLTAAIIP